MPFRFNAREHAALLVSLLRNGLLGAIVGVFCGCSSALFLHALNWATATQARSPFLLYLLPLAGVLIAFFYERFGKSVEGGNNLLLERVHDARQIRPIPFRLAPLVLGGTILTHLFGGSAGREGTAVQMGGTLANLLTKPLRLSAREHRLLILSGISGGFGSVFGTPLAGTVFGLEVSSLGHVSTEALVPCFVASCVGDAVCRALGITHHAYVVGTLPSPTPLLWGGILLAGVLFAGASWLFTELTDGIAHLAKRYLANPLLRPVVGGVLIIGMSFALGTREYLGLSLPMMEKSFEPRGVPLYSFLAKTVFTAVTLGTGFKGGEVTPLFGIGATLGSAFAQVGGLPVGFFAALGFVAVFAGAANTPLACAIMGIELFGSPMAVPLLAVCLTAYVLSGHRGIYASQRIQFSKGRHIAVRRGTLVREARTGRQRVWFRFRPK